MTPGVRRPIFGGCRHSCLPDVLDALEDSTRPRTSVRGCFTSSNRSCVSPNEARRQTLLSWNQRCRQILRRDEFHLLHPR